MGNHKRKKPAKVRSKNAWAKQVNEKEHTAKQKRLRDIERKARLEAEVRNDWGFHD